MTRNEIKKQVINNLIEVVPYLKDIEINESDNLTNDLGLDSLDIIELTIKIEKDRNISIPDEDIEIMKTWSVKNLINYIFLK